MIDIIKRYEIWLLRGAVAFPMLWAGIGGLVNPANWIGFVPQFVESFVDKEVFLLAHSILLIGSAVLILTGPWRWFFALVALGNLGGILIFYGLDDITFRDVGLALVALVLSVREYKVPE
ncbi:MAG: hypothetical protein Q8P99_02720 [bacterium]|nr:hypothetical protein [bacterium]MDZ4231312.1 hypothetical protein [Patescibacteria group bacterium]